MKKVTLWALAAIVIAGLLCGRVAGPAQAGVDQNGNQETAPTTTAVSYTDNSGTTTAGSWVEISGPNPYRHGYRYFPWPNATDYLNYTSTSTPPSGSPSSTANSTPGAEPVPVGGAILTDSQDAPSGYIWVYSTTSHPYTEKEF